MAGWMNEDDIEQAVAVLSARAPDLAPYARLLSAWKDTVNRNSDGWAHWRAGSRCATRLMDLVSDASEKLNYGRPGDLPTAEQMQKTLPSIKAAATKHHLVFPDLEVAAPAPRR